MSWLVSLLNPFAEGRIFSRKTKEIPVEWIFGPTTSDLYQTAKRYCDETNHIPEEKLRHSLMEANVFASKLQIREILKASESKDRISIGKFILCVQEFLANPNCRHSWQRNRRHSLETSQRPTKNSPSFQVFLGGSCNPTTWRAEFAIPFLTKNYISFYNPQVSEWRPQLVQIEQEAKDNAQVLLYIIDNRTRCAASMVELAQLAGNDREIFVVIEKYPGPGWTIGYGEPLSTTEFNELQQAQCYLTDLLERSSVPVFESLETALVGIKKCLEEDLSVKNLKVTDGVQPVLHGHLNVGKKLICAQEVFKAFDYNNKGNLDLKSACEAFRTITGKKLNERQIQAQSCLGHITLDQFCAILAEFDQGSESSWGSSLLNGFLMVRNLFDMLSPLPECYWEPPAVATSFQYDIYLGGYWDDSSWQSRIAVPKLKKQGMTFYKPQKSELTAGMVAADNFAKEQSRVLLFIICGDTRGSVVMIEASFHVAKNHPVILCITDIPEGGAVEGEQLSSTAIKDYNRARTYLTDLALRHHIPILDDVEQAVDTAIEKVFVFYRENASK